MVNPACVFWPMGTRSAFAAPPDWRAPGWAWRRASQGLKWPRPRALPAPTRIPWLVAPAMSGVGPAAEAPEEREEEQEERSFLRSAGAPGPRRGRQQPASPAGRDGAPGRRDAPDRARVQNRPGGCCRVPGATGCRGKGDGEARCRARCGGPRFGALRACISPNTPSANAAPSERSCRGNSSRIAHRCLQPRVSPSPANPSGVPQALDEPLLDSARL